jgi:hypothetical protein
MSALFGLLIVASFILCVVCLINPVIVTKIFKKAEGTRKNALLFFGVPFIVLFILSGFVLDGKKSAVSSSSSVQADKPEEKAVEQTQVIGTPDQVAFHKNLTDFASKYIDADNEMKKSKVYREMGSFMKGYLSGRTFSNWEGKLTKIGTTEGGKKAYITIESNFSDKEIAYKTWNNELSDLGTNSMLNLSSAVYKQVENLSEGDIVVFSGSFIYDDKKTFAESSLTEIGTVTDPEFIIKFSSIKKK